MIAGSPVSGIRSVTLVTCGMHTAPSSPLQAAS